MHSIVSTSAPAAVHEMLPTFGYGIGFHADQVTPQIDLDADAIGALVALGVTRYQLTVRWAVLSETGAVDHPMLDELARTAEQLLAVGIEPLVAFDNAAVPERLEADGGWRNAATISAYIDVVGAVGARLGHLVDQWLTITNPPAVGSAVVEHLAVAHRQALVVLRAHCPQALIGTTIGIGELISNPTDPGQAVADPWLAALGDEDSPIDFVALNVDCTSSLCVESIADCVRLLARRTTAQSFILVEKLSGSSLEASSLNASSVEAQYEVGGPSRFDSKQRAALADSVRAQVRELRNEGVAITGTFSWPFGHPADATPIRMTEWLADPGRQGVAERLN